MNVAHIGDRRDGYKFYRGNVRERYHLEDPGVDEVILFRWNFRKWDVRAWTGSTWLRIGTVDVQL